MNISAYYQQQLTSGKISPDKNQAFIIEKLQQLSDALITAENKKNQHIHKIKSYFKKPLTIHGIYLWGNVGVGKTFLLDAFYQCLPIKRKLRMHFHAFMQMIHLQLKALQGKANPLTIIAKELAQRTAVLCFDELYVNNIVDAMILGNLFKAIYAEGICTIFTSNCAPDDLYKNGLQRQQFLPAIAAIKKHNEVIHITSEKDYRLRFFDHKAFYWHPIDKQTRKNMEDCFAFYAKNQQIYFEAINICEREIKIIKRTGNIIWFDFIDLCGAKRSQEDYLVLTKQYHTIFISNLMPILAKQNDLAQNFIKLIDIFYDARIKLILLANVPIEELYQGKIFQFDFARTQSRLIEMQSMEYAENIDHSP